MDIAQQIRRALELGGTENAIYYQGAWYSWNELNQFSLKLNKTLNSIGSNGKNAVGLIARNHVAHAAVLATLIGHNHPVTMLYAFQSEQGLVKDIADLNLKVVIACSKDCTPLVLRAAKGHETTVITTDPPLNINVITNDSANTTQKDYRELPEPGIEILSSGTTGAPKRIFHAAPILFRTIISSGQGDQKNDTPSDIVCWPFSGIGGVCQIMRPLALGAPAVLLEKFSVADAVNAIQAHKPEVFAVTPTMLRMIVDAQVPVEKLQSLKAIFGGSGPLDLALMDQFEATYNIPILWAMGATEFCGTIIAWTPDLKQQYPNQKRGSCGKPLAGVSIRIVDTDTHAILPPNQLGCMEVKVDILGDDWVATTDLARIDKDGFVYLEGRNDGAIIRGGFKVLPEAINECLRTHPAIEEAAVLGVKDKRLGHVPVAIIQFYKHVKNVDKLNIDAFLRERLKTPQIPVAFHSINDMPFTASLKVNLATLRDQYENGLLPRLAM